MAGKATQSKDVIDRGSGLYIVQLFNVPTIPDTVRHNGYYKARCEISHDAHGVETHECIVHRPSNRRNVVGTRQTDWLLLMLEVPNWKESELIESTLRIVDYSVEIKGDELKI